MSANRPPMTPQGLAAQRIWDQASLQSPAVQSQVVEYLTNGTLPSDPKARQIVQETLAQYHVTTIPPGTLPDGYQNPAAPGGPQFHYTSSRIPMGSGLGQGGQVAGGLFASFQADQAQRAMAPKVPDNQQTAPPPSSAPPAAVRSPQERGPGFNDTPQAGAPGAEKNKAAIAAAQDQAAATAPPATTNAPNVPPVTTPAQGANTVPNIAGNPGAGGARTELQNFAYSGSGQANDYLTRQVLQAMHLNPDNLGLLGNFITGDVGNTVKMLLPYLGYANGGTGQNPDILGVIQQLAQGIGGSAQNFAGQMQGLGRSVLSNPAFQSAMGGMTGNDAFATQMAQYGGLLPLLLYGANDLTKNAALSQYNQATNRAYDAAANALQTGAQAPSNFGSFVASNASALSPDSILRRLLGL